MGDFGVCNVTSVTKLCDNLIQSVRDASWEVNFNPNIISDIETRIESMVGTVNGLPRDEYKVAVNYLVNKISADMLMSFLLSMYSTTDPIAYRILQLLNTVDKKWVGMYDEEMAGNLIEYSRADICDELFKYSYLNCIQYFIGLIKQGYFNTFELDPNPNDTRFMMSELKAYLTRGTFMDSDEHTSNLCLFDFKVGNPFREIFSSPDVLLNNIINAVRSFCQTTIIELTKSGYNHTDLEGRLYARDLFAQRLSTVILNTLTNGDLGSRDHEWLKRYVVVSNSDHKIATDLDLLAVVSPIADISLRIIIEGHIMSSNRMAKIKTFSMLYDTIMLRRNLVNEKEYIKYQDSIGRQDESYAGRVCRYKRKPILIG